MDSVAKKIFLPGVPILTLLGVWYIAVEYKLVEAFLLPSPLSVYNSIIQLFVTGDIYEHLLATLTRVSVSFILAVVTAVPVGLMLGWYSLLGQAFNPLIELFRTISPISWIPLAILWFGIGNEPAIFILFMSAFFPMLIASKNAVSQVDPILVRVAENLGATGRKLLTQVILPGSTPYIFVAMRISLGISWVVVVAAEMAGLRSGLGYLILDGRNLLETELVMAGMVIIGIIGLLLDQLMQILGYILGKRGFLQI